MISCSGVPYRSHSPASGRAAYHASISTISCSTVSGSRIGSGNVRKPCLKAWRASSSGCPVSCPAVCRQARQWCANVPRRFWVNENSSSGFRKMRKRGSQCMGRQRSLPCPAGMLSGSISASSSATALPSRIVLGSRACSAGRTKGGVPVSNVSSVMGSAPRSTFRPLPSPDALRLEDVSVRKACSSSSARVHAT